MTDISFLKAVVKRRQDEKHKKWYTYLLQIQPIKTVYHCGGKKCCLLFQCGLTKPATSNKESVTCCEGLIEECLFQARGVERVESDGQSVTR